MTDKSSAATSEAMMIMLAPDGYYTYLGVKKETSSDNTSGPDIDLIKKNYRKLSIKHHPDKPQGDVETFRLLKRAQTVLSSPKLRQQYDILGLDLDDDEEEHNIDSSTNTDDGGPEPQTTSQGIVHEIASMALTAVLQFAVRTALMGFVSVFVARYRLLLMPAMAILAYVAYSIRNSPAFSGRDFLSPFLIGTGLIIMYQASSGSWSYTVTESGKDGATTTINWLLFWAGESMVIFMFTFNSMGLTQQQNILITAVVACFAIIAALWFRGKFWNYVIVIGLECFLALFIALSFPIFEMILEAILNDKLRKVGDKVRAQHVFMEKYYQQQCANK
jgi:curved DNA-binding protein CbpA